MTLSTSGLIQRRSEPGQNQRSPGTILSVSPGAALAGTPWPGLIGLGQYRASGGIGLGSLGELVKGDHLMTAQRAMPDVCNTGQVRWTVTRQHSGRCRLRAA
jgi:hypothetical protein